MKYAIENVNGNGMTEDELTAVHCAMNTNFDSLEHAYAELSAWFRAIDWMVTKGGHHVSLSLRGQRIAIITDEQS